MIHEQPVIFHANGVPLVGRFWRPGPGFGEPGPVVIVLGSWLTVKEQMASTYAAQLAARGYTAFSFDFSGFGQSHGEPAGAELPARKIADLHAALQFLATLSFVDAARIGCLSICASAQYTLRALAGGLPLRSFASVAGWYHDLGSIAPFYGGEAGVQARFDRSRAALERYVSSGEVTYVPAYEDGNERAGMHFRLDYYARPERGAVPAWKNRMAELSWFYWLSFDGLAAAPAVQTPSLFVHSDGAVFPEHVRRVHAALRGPKRLVWAEGEQIDFYDQPAQVARAVDAADAWFRETLGS